ncbi:MAG: cupin domain-containing protein [Methylovulum sp.]|nr:cupin domain-containing protein [Methylovulum sp.]
MKNQTTPVLANIFSAIPDGLPEELFECLLKQDNILIERIISKGHITPEGQWYDQAWDEWAILIQGQATLCFGGQQNKLVSLAAGDYLLIPAHTKHRVEWTPAGLSTIWLAIHLHGAKIW